MAATSQYVSAREGWWGAPGHDTEMGEVSFRLQGELGKIHLQFCLKCVKGLQIRYCDGSVFNESLESFITKHTCVYPKSETWTPSNGEHMRGPIAVKKLIEIRPRIILDQTERRDRWLFRNWCKPIVNYHHIASCFHGSNPQVVVQGHKGLGRSIYFRRCNRDLINAFREVLEVSEYKEPGNKTEDDSHITETQEDEKDGKRKRKIEDENEDGVQVKQARRNPIITHMIDEIEAYIDEHNAHSKMESSTARETTLTPSSPEDLKRACQGLSTETIIKYEEYVATGKWSFTVDCLAELSWRSTRERGDGEEIWSDSEEDPGESETDN